MENRMRRERLEKEREELKRMERTVNNCPFRTKLHIMPPVGWLNDPNGLCQFRGVFHAYFQYSPLSVNGGGGYWGHCTSTDMLHWEYQEPVLTADVPEDAGGVYSGCALIENDRMYLFYTGNVKKPGDYDYIDAGRVSTQMLVESADGQQTSQKIKLLGMEDYPGDITQHVRDPKVWKENGRYYMVLGARARAWDESGERSDKGGILIYESDDMRKWSLSEELVPGKKFGYMWECPDIFTLGGGKVLSFCPQGLPSEEERYQNIYQSGYTLLSEGGHPEETFREWDMGFDFYAPQTFETEDQRRILIGWAGVPDTQEEHRNLSVRNGWQHCLTIPTELICRDGIILRRPVRELEALPWEKADAGKKKTDWSDRVLKLKEDNIGGEERRYLIGGEDNGMAVSLGGDRVELSFINRSKEPSECGGGRKMRTGRVRGEVEDILILIDSSVAEIFVNGGELVFTTRFYLDKSERTIETGRGQAEIYMV